MELNLIRDIIEECKSMRDMLPDSQNTLLDFFIGVDEIVSEYANEGVDCLMNINFKNGTVTQGLCLITDWEPGALAFQSDEGGPPEMRVIFPQDYESFMESVAPIFAAEYPKFPYGKK